MNSSSSLKLDEHLARLLAAYDQEIGQADGKAPTIDVPPAGPGVPSPVPGEVPVGPLSVGPIHQGAVAELLPDSLPTDAPPIPDPRAVTGGHRIGRFELRRQLGRGGCGIVFLAYDPKLQREVALKIPRTEMLLSADARRRLIREAQAAAEFDHPNLVPVYETGEIGPVCYVATAFCPGQTLAEWLDRQAYPVPVRQAARLVAQVADAVQHAHDRGVVHRDLKPNNVILQVVRSDPNDQEPPPGSCPLRGEHFIPRVVDFGLAKLAERGPGDTASRQVLGTPKYMAPEQAQGRYDELDARADVYALGVILYEMIAGRAPYEGATDVEVLRQAIEGNLVPPHDLRKDVPRDLEAICLKAMDRSPARRYRTAIDLADDLRRFLDGLPTLARPPGRLGRAARWLRRNDQLVALAMVSLTAVFFAAVGGWTAYQAGPLRTNLDALLRQQDARSRTDQQWEYARHVHDAFLSWRAGDAPQMADSLFAARTMAERMEERPDFAWGYLSQLGRGELASIGCPAGAAVALAVSPDGTRAATGHLDGTLAVWDRASGRLIAASKMPAGEAQHVAFVGGGAGLVTGGEAAARLWTLTPSNELKPGPALPGSAAPVTAITARPDGQTLYLGLKGGDCLAWDVAGGRVLKQWPATDGAALIALAVSPDGKAVATVGQFEPLKLWDLADTAEPVTQIVGAIGMSSVVFARDELGGWLLVAGRDDGTIRTFDRQGREVRSLPAHAGALLTLAVSPDGLAVASGGQDDCVCVWDVGTGSMRALFRGHEQPIRGVQFGPDGRTLFTASEDGQLKVWDLTADPEGHAIRTLTAPVAALALHPEGPEFAVAYTDGGVAVYPQRGGGPQRFPSAGRRPLVALRWGVGGPPVGVELSGRLAACWQFGERPERLLAAETAGGTATAADLSLSSGRVAVGDNRGRVAVWSLSAGRPIAIFDTRLEAPVRHLCFSDDGKWLAALTDGFMVGVWEVGDPKARYRVAGHGDGLWLVRFLPGGERLLTAGRGSSIKVWDVTRGREDLSLLGHVGRVTGLTASPDGRTLVSASNTGEVKLWDLRTGQELIGLRRHAGSVTCAEFAPSGRLLITAGTTTTGRGELVFWDAKE